MAKNPKERIGAGLEDADEILKHPFFATLDIKELLAKKLEAEYVPLIGDKYSVENFDPAVTAEDPVAVAIPAPNMELIKKFDEEFKDFSEN